MSNESILKADRRTVVYDNATEAIGNTPLIYINKITKDLPARIASKIEFYNPGCSVKDRVSVRMIQEAEEKGLITPGVTTLIEATSGNMGIALAYASVVKGYKLILTMPSSMSIERRTVLKAYGAVVILTDPALAVVGALNRAKELLEIVPNSYMLNQFENPANITAHYNTTGPEIWSQTQGKVDIVCFGVGSGGTVMGVGKYLREKKPEVKVYAVEPVESSVLNGFPHSPHKIAGMGAGLIPPIVNIEAIDEALRVSSDESIEMAQRLAKEEGLLVGISSGANMCAAIQLAKRPENKGKLIVTSFASFGERYLSSDLYKKLKDDSEKMKITTLEEDKADLKAKFFI